MQKTYQEWKKAGVVKDYDEKIRKKIGRTSRWGSDKQMSAVQAAILDTLYRAGPGLCLSPKDMLNDQTRLAYAIDSGLIIEKRVDKRNQKSCGHDEFNGFAYEFYLLDPPQDVNNLTSVWSWKRRKDPVIVRFSGDDITQEKKDARVAHVESFIEGLRDTYGVEEELALEDVVDDRDKKLAWLLQERDNQWWEGTLEYRLFESLWDYKGECDWDRNTHCSHHRGRRSETVLLFTGSLEEDQRLVKYLSNEYELNGRTYLYFDELKDPIKWVKEHVADINVVQTIKQQIPKMKTDSRQWIHSTWTEYRYVYEDENGNETYDYERGRRSVRYEQIKHGKRGHYQLSWWNQFKDEERREITTAMLKQKRGLQANGWVVKTDNEYQPSSGWWSPIKPVRAHSVGGFHFVLRKDAEDFAKAVLSFRKKMYTPKMTTEGAMIDVQIKKSAIGVRLSIDSDPGVYTPETVVHRCLNRQEIAEGITFETRPCTYIEEEE